MANLFKTNLKITAAQLPPDFSGTPAEFLRAIVERLDIFSPVGTNFFVVGDVEPPTNQGPWLKDGKTWYVFDEDEGKYVPADISDSTLTLFTVSDAEPEPPVAGEDALIWLRTKSNRVLGWYFWDGEEWRPEGHTPPSGPTADRPSDPGDLEQFFDTTCGCLIHWERGAWRTVSGTPGDVKFVTAPLLADAIAFNPGWEYLGENSQDFRGKVLGVATKDPGATPAISYSTASGITARAQGSLAGAETVVLADLDIPQHSHLVGAVNALGNNHNANFYRVDNNQAFVAPGSGPPNYEKTTGAIFDSASGALPAATDGCALVTSTQLAKAIAPSPYTSDAAAHQNMQPTVFLWALQKV